MKKLILTLTCAILLLNSFAQHTFNTEYNQYFEKTYQLHPDIPKGILEAVAYTNTRVRHIALDEQQSCTGMPQALGVMGLVFDGKDIFRENGHVVSFYANLHKNVLLTSPQKCIEGYAITYETLLKSTGLVGKPVEEQLHVITGISELPIKGTLSNFAINSFLYSVLDILNNPDFQEAYNTPYYSIDLEKVFGENYPILSSSFVSVSHNEIKNEAGDIYTEKSLGGCLDYPQGIWNGAASCNYSSRGTTAVSAVTIHTVQGSYAGCISWFQNCQAGVSAHYVVRSSDGQVTQMVCESAKAWHVGSENPYTIGIEHEGYVNDPQTWYTNAMYNGSAALVRDITNSGYGISPLRTFDNNPRYNWNDELGGCIKIKGHINYPNQSHTDPGSGWDWEKYYQLINNNPNTTTLTAASGNFYDSGGQNGNYSDDERTLYLFSPTGASSVTLNFSQFDLESNWDYLYIYDGNSLSSPLIGTYTGTTSPGTITSSGGSLLVELRSDCATNNAGWAATWTSNAPVVDVTPPTTSLSISNWKTYNFPVNFTDADNSGGSGIDKAYYQVMDFDGTEWRANGSHGFFNDNFATAIHTDWTTIAGAWSINTSRLRQSDETNGNTNMHASVSQGSGNSYLYHWQMNQNGTGTNRRAGIHFFCDNASLTNRGNSYFVFFRVDNNKCQIYKVINDAWALMTDDAITVNPNVWYDYKVTYNPSTGTIKAYQNDVLASSWTDPSPLTNGNAISLRTGNTIVEYDDVKVYKSRGASVTVTIGSPSDEVRYQNPDPFTPSCRVRTIVQDNAENWSTAASQDANIDWTRPDMVSVNDGTGTDIDITYSTTQLEANWSTSADQHSDIARYWYSLGYTPGGIEVLNWTDNGLNTSVTNSGLSLSVGTTYYYTVRAENGAGLLGTGVISDGQLVDINTGMQSAEGRKQLVIYPNPTDESFVVSYNLNDENSIIQLHDATGKLIYQQNLKGNKQNLVFSKQELNLASGIYNISILTEKETLTEKLIIK